LMELGPLACQDLLLFIASFASMGFRIYVTCWLLKLLTLTSLVDPLQLCGRMEDDRNRENTTELGPRGPVPAQCPSFFDRCITPIKPAL
jgi:hypothetical protein